MKKILSLVLAFALVLSVASVAFGAWDAAAETPKGAFKLTVTKYEPKVDDLTNDYFLANANIGSVNGVIAYYSIKLEIPKDHGLNIWPDDEADGDELTEGMSFTIDFGDGIKIVDGSPFIHPDDVDNIFGDMLGVPPDDDAKYVLYYVYAPGQTDDDPVGYWSDDPKDAGNLIVITDSAKASIKACLTYNAALLVDGDGDFPGVAFGGSDDDDWTLVFYSDDELLFVENALNPINFMIERGDKGKFESISTINGVIEDVVGEGLKADGVKLSPAEKAALDDLLSALGISSFSALKKAYFTNANIRANLTDSFKVCSDVVWGAYTPDPLLVAIPKTGGNAGVIGLAMVMVAIVTAAVALKKVKA